MEEWKEYQLKDVTTILGDGLHGTPEYDDNGTVFFINGNNLVNGKIEIKDSTKRVSKDEANKYKKNLTERTILVSINGTIGNVAKYKGEACILGKSACYFNVADNFDLNFIYYVVASQQFKDSMTRLATGTTIKNVSLETMRNYSFPAPSINEQKRISAVLSSLDSKIELNRRINDNLEQQAQALFKSWFVDFEPFKDGKFVESEMGMIPEEWKVASLKELVFNTNSGDWGKEEPTGNYTVRVYCMRGADFPEVKEGNIGKMPIRYILQKNFDNKALKHGNMIVEISGGSPTQSTGRAVLIDKIFIDYCENALVCTNFCRSLTIREKYALFFFLTWQCLYDKKVMFIYENGSNGLKNLNLNDLLEKETIVIPPLEIIERFNLLTAKLFELKYFNGSETARLNQIRDTLLPRLMSGELKINDLNC